MWRKLEAAVAELSRLSREICDEMEFYSRFAGILTNALELQGLRIWKRGPSDRPTAIFASPDWSDQVDDATSVLEEPIPGETQSIGAIEVRLTRTTFDGLGDNGRLFLRTAAEIAGEYHRNSRVRELQAELTRRDELISAVKIWQAAGSLGELAYAAADELRKYVGCDRVVVLSNRLNDAAVLAVSSTESFNARSAPLSSWRRLVKFTNTTDESLWWEDLRREERHGILEEVIADVREACRTVDFGLLPITGRIGEREAVVGRIACEWFTEPADNDARHRAESATALLSPLFAGQTLRAGLPLRALGEGYAGLPWNKDFSILARRGFVVAALALILVVVSLIPVPFTIEAEGELLPVNRRHLFAPADGMVTHLAIPTDGVVKANEVLVRLDNPQWRLELDDVLGQAAVVEKELEATRTERLRTAGSGDSSGDGSSTVAARIEQLEVKGRELRTQRRILELRQADLEVRSPLSGGVLTWDWEQRLAGRPVKRGERLLTVAEIEGPWKLEIRIPDDQVGYVLSARAANAEPPAVSFRTASDPGECYSGKLGVLSPTAEPRDSARPVVIGTVENISPRLPQPRPGVTTTASISCGRRSLGFVWLRPLWELWREYVW